MAYFSINIYSLTKTNQLYLTARQLENAEEYNKTLQDSIEWTRYKQIEQRSNDYKNQLQKLENENSSLNSRIQTLNEQTEQLKIEHKNRPIFLFKFGCSNLYIIPSVIKSLSW